MSANEREWELLSDLWRTSAPQLDSAAVQKLVAGYRRRLAAVVCGEILTVAGFAWLSWLFLRDGAELWETVWITTLWSFTAVAVPFAWWNRRGTWSAMGETVAEFQRQRAVRRMRSLKFACWLFLAEVVAVGAELAWFDRFTVASAVFLATFAFVLGAWAIWMEKRVTSEIRVAEDA